MAIAPLSVIGYSALFILSATWKERENISRGHQTFVSISTVGTVFHALIMPIIKLAGNHCLMTIPLTNGFEQHSLFVHCGNGSFVSLLSVTAVKEVPYLCSAALHQIDQLGGFLFVVGFIF